MTAHISPENFQRRVVAERLRQHITQRGSGRNVVFDDGKDRRVYVKRLRVYAEKFRLLIWALVHEEQSCLLARGIAARNWQRARSAQGW